MRLCREKAIDEMKPFLTEEELGKARRNLWGVGEFQKFRYVAAEIKQGKDTLAITEVTALYEERSVTYRISRTRYEAGRAAYVVKASGGASFLKCGIPNRNRAVYNCKR